MTAGLAGAASPLAAQRAPGPSPVASVPDSEIKVPKVKFGKVEVSRLIIGCNWIWGTPHYNALLQSMISEWLTSARVVEFLHQAEKYGINGINYIQKSRSQADWERYQAEGGKMHVIALTEPTEVMLKAVKPMAVWILGERTDSAFRAGQMNTIRDQCKQLRDMGVQMVGVGSHIPEVLAMVEEQGWDVDFYAGCVYNRRRTVEELRKLMSGELPEMAQEVYLQDDPPRMYKVFRQTKKPCFAFKIMAAGRVRNFEAATKLAYESIKPNDFVCVGIFPRNKDELKENAYWATRYGTVAS
jgi:hypothetical protein